MTDQAAVAPPHGMIPGVQIKGCIEQSISTDGQAAMVVFEIAEAPGKLAITMPVSALGVLLTVVNDLRVRAERQNLDPGQVIFRQPAEFMVGHADHIRGHVAMTFNPGKPDEAVFLLADADGLNLASMVERDILSRMPLAERQTVLHQKKQIVPPHFGASKLILPRR